MIKSDYNLNTRQCLGRKTYWIFLLNRSFLALFFLLTAIVFLILSSIGSEVLTSSVNLDGGSINALQAFFVLGLLISLFLFILIELLAVIWTYYEYKNYTFILDQHGLEVSRGIIDKENISIPYHHIEDVNIEQSLFYQMLGVCRLVIMTAARASSESNSHDQQEGILPTVDLEMGREIQRTILARSNVQEVISSSPVS